MDELWIHFNQDHWDYFIENLVVNEIDSNLEFYAKVQSLKLFDDDICQAIASLSQYMFKGNFDEFKVWIEQPVPALNNHSMRQLVKHKNGMNWIREFILRQR